MRRIDTMTLESSYQLAQSKAKAQVFGWFFLQKWDITN